MADLASRPGADGAEWRDFMQGLFNRAANVNVVSSLILAYVVTFQNTISALLKFTDSPITTLDYHQYNGGIYNHRSTNLDCGVDSTNAICDAYGSLLSRLSQCWMRYIPFICPLGCAGTRVQGMISPIIV